ncbi:uncharacterized protein [Nicotiana tomentosiformis]|uniref:uncharacterized protein n=1 Tax=Nicotiana tomentosiformis TaxID=4098 RepID=UPI00388CC453
MVRAAASEEGQLRFARFKRYNPPTFSGLALESAHGFLEECHNILHTMDIVETSGVAFTMFQLKGAAYQWWRAYEMGSLAKLASLTWVQLSEMFLREHAPALVATIRERVCRFIEGLRHDIRFSMARELESDVSFQQVSIDRELCLSSLLSSFLMRFSFHIQSIAFCASSVLACGFIRPVGVLTSPRHYFTKDYLDSCHEKLQNKGIVETNGVDFAPAFSKHSAPISAPPLQSHYSGYPASSGQLQLQQPRQQDGCHECGNIGHIKRYCPRLSRNRSRQDSRAIVPVPVASPPAQLARDGGQAVRGGGQPVRGHPRDAVQSGGAQPRFYAFPARLEDESSDAMITGAIMVNNKLRNIAMGDVDVDDDAMDEVPLEPQANRQGRPPQDNVPVPPPPPPRAAPHRVLPNEGYAML